MRFYLLILIPVLLMVATGCEMVSTDAGEDGEIVLRVPVGFDRPVIPAHNPMTPEKVVLGEKLFFDPILSRDGTMSCASCHHPELAFAEDLAVSRGVEGRLGIRNSPSLVNVAYVPLFFWDGGSLSLESQVLAPLEAHHEMDADLGVILERLAANANYLALFQDAFGAGPSIPTLTQAIATYERTLLSGGSRYDRYTAGQEPDALTAAERRGMALFEGKAGCVACHQGPRLTDDRFANNGLAFAHADSGRARITLNPADFALFRVPSLRNVTLTAPYMHDGRLMTLEEVVAHYNTGGTGARGQDPAIRPLGLSTDEQTDLVRFLHALTDESIHMGLMP